MRLRLAKGTALRARSRWVARSAAVGAGDSEDIRSAHDILSAFDKAQVAASQSVEGLERGTVATRYGNAWEGRSSLWEAVTKLANASDSIVIGFCASDANEGVSELKGWVSSLKLNRGRLHGMDDDGKARDMSDFGPVYIRYVSSSGDAYLSGYDGNYRGVYFTPNLSDGEFRQYGVLPLGLYQESSGAITNSKELGIEVLRELEAMKAKADALNIQIHLESIEEATGEVTVRCAGDPKMTESVGVSRWLKSTLEAIPGVSVVHTSSG